jgi:cellulose synthase/poly-beta-1,6-N-acetylglucosamine synthase-like glycosyltransferase
MTGRVLSSVLWVASVLVSFPIAVFLIECLASLGKRRARPSGEPAAPPRRLAVLVPAHDEEELIARTVESIRSQLSAGDRIWVIADNCSDQTAARAQEAGAVVLERRDPDRRGKVAALSFGLERLAQDPPDVVIFVDADTPLEPGSIQALQATALERDRPVQAVYLLNPPPGAGAQAQFSALAFAIKNYVRPRGLARLGWPCPLVGTGMAIPWSLMQRVRFSEDSIVEDLQLGIDLAVAGHPAVLCEEAGVRGFLPSTASAGKVQRRRWEHGHLRTILTQVPRLMAYSIAKARLGLLAMALDLGVPPLSLLCLLWGMVTAGAIVGAFRGASPLPAWVCGTAGALLGVGVLAAWAGHLRKQMSFLIVLGMPFYMFLKIPLYFGFLFARETKWVRTPRDAPVPARPPTEPPR